MGEKKVHRLTVRFSDNQMKILEEMVEELGCKSMSEALRFCMMYVWRRMREGSLPKTGGGND